MLIGLIQNTPSAKLNNANALTNVTHFYEGIWGHSN
jgi:hypothetical protein